MKRSKKMILLLCLLAAVCAATLVMRSYEGDTEQIQSTQEVILALSGSSVEALSWSYEDTALSFHRNEKNTWLYDEDGDFPVDQEQISALLAEFQELAASFVIEEVTDFAQYGLEEPLCTILLSTDSQDYTVQLGAYSQIDGLRYVSIGDGKVYLTSSDPMDAFAITLDTLFLHDTLPEMETVTKISFAGLFQKEILYSEAGGASYSADDVWFMDGAPLDTDLVEGYLSTITGLSLTSCVSHTASKEELSEWGLETPAMTITISYTTEQDDGTKLHHTQVLHLGTVTDSDDTAYYYLRLENSELIYKLTANKYNALTAVAYDDLRHSQVFTADFDTVTAMEITLAGATYSMERVVVTEEAEEGSEEEQEESIVWMFGETEVDTATIQAALEALTADGFTEEAAATQEEIRILLHLDNAYSDTLQILLYRLDGIHCLCEVNGETICYVSRSSVVTLIEAVNSIILNG